jgi:hypothetical protein
LGGVDIKIYDLCGQASVFFAKAPVDFGDIAPSNHDLSRNISTVKAVRGYMALVLVVVLLSMV